MAVSASGERPEWGRGKIVAEEREVAPKKRRKQAKKKTLQGTVGGENINVGNLGGYRSIRGVLGREFISPTKSMGVRGKMKRKEINAKGRRASTSQPQTEST